ncbi:hypothetical protein SG0499 [Sodalis glossinidius str. 'morsitans']|uniref:Uncharacterized protein n=1 Tax=Sodalis glossinidius (strain morsitans) TaxID=343509 RepID=Q2NVQ1_SODGM|nr:hypothetical protein SG0499 [Sodalis glossinidius str. 'morsitans']
MGHRRLTEIDRGGASRLVGQYVYSGLRYVSQTGRGFGRGHRRHGERRDLRAVSVCGGRCARSLQPYISIIVLRVLCSPTDHREVVGEMEPSLGLRACPIDSSPTTYLPPSRLDGILCLEHVSIRKVMAVS